MGKRVPKCDSLPRINLLCCTHNPKCDSLPRDMCPSGCHSDRESDSCLLCAAGLDTNLIKSSMTTYSEHQQKKCINMYISLFLLIRTVTEYVNVYN